jgi:uncharacterized protein DUF4190
MSHPEQPSDPRPGGQAWQEHSPPPVDPQAPAGYPQHSHGYPSPPPVDPQSPVNYPDYSYGYPPPPPVDPRSPVNYPGYSQGYRPPPVEPQSPVGYPESAPGYPPSPPGFYPPPPYQAGPPGYPSYSGYPGYPEYPDPYDPYRPIPTPGTNGLAIGSLVASIGGFPLLFACYAGVAAWIAGIVLGIIALNQIKQTRQEGRGLAIAGIAVGVVGLVVAALAAILLIAAYSTSKTY